MANEDVDGTPAHFLVGLNIYTGAQELNVAVDPPGDDPGHLLQRTGLNLDDGNVVFGYGSYEGGCNPNHGWVASVPETGGTPNFYDTTGDAQGLPAAVGAEGSVWMGGAAPEVDADGNIWLGSGNSSPDTPYDGGDSVIELSPSLQLEQFFAPSDWSYQNANDQDLGSEAPALLSNGTLLQVGKSFTAYLLNQSDLGGVDTTNSAEQAPACPGNNADGGPAIDGTIVYIGCFDGLQAIQTQPSLSVLWTAHVPGPAIIAGGLVWSIGSRGSRWVGPSDRGYGRAARHRPQHQPLPHRRGR